MIGTMLPPMFMNHDNMPPCHTNGTRNELAFCVAQAFFPRTAMWDNLKRESRGVYADSVCEHLADTLSQPFAPGKHCQIAVKVIDDRADELLVVRKLEEAEDGRAANTLSSSSLGR